jgi:nucleotide-binding universal stress UspA family protein
MRPLAIRSVLATTDLSDASAAVLRTAADLARLAEAKMTVLHVQETGAVPDTAALKHQALTSIPADVAADFRIVGGEPARAIGQMAEQLRPSVIVLGPHGRLKHRRKLGSTADRVVREAQVPCLVLPVQLSLPLSRVLIPIDLSESAYAALLVGLSWASAFRQPKRAPEAPRTEVTVLHVAHGDVARTDAEETLHRQIDLVEARTARAAGVFIGERVEGDGDPARVVLDHATAQSSDLVVLCMRSSARTPDNHLGSVTQTIVKSCPRPMLLVPPEVWRGHEAAA